MIKIKKHKLSKLVNDLTIISLYNLLSLYRLYLYDYLIYTFLYLFFPLLVYDIINYIMKHLIILIYYYIMIIQLILQTHDLFYLRMIHHYHHNYDSAFYNFFIQYFKLVNIYHLHLRFIQLFKEILFQLIIFF